MRNIPIQPVVRLALAKVLNEHFGMRGTKAVATATKIIELLRAQGFDIIKGDWMAGGVEKAPFQWEDLAAMVAGFENDPRAPWNAPELK